MKEPSVAPFRAVRYDPKKVGGWARVVAPPYDVINEKMQKARYERDPHNVVRLILGMHSPTDHEGDNRYTRAAQSLHEWLKQGILVEESKPAFYLYEQTFLLKGKGSCVRRGFLALKKLEEFQKGKVIPHEKTLSGPKADRLLLMKACRANLSPVFALYADPEKKLTAVLQSYFNAQPDADFVDEDGVRQRVWRVCDPELFTTANEVLSEKKLFIADGHHRYETALAFRDWIQSEDPAFNYILMFFAETSDPGLLILPTHRVLHDWPSFDPQTFLKALEADFNIQIISPREEFLKKLAQEEGCRLAIGMLLKGNPHQYILIPKNDHDPRLGVDTQTLHEKILKGVLHFSEEDQKNPQFLNFVKDRDEAMQMKDEGGGQAVFLLNPPLMEALEKIVEKGKILPPKTTYFYPKLLTGLVFYLMDPVAI